MNRSDQESYYRRVGGLIRVERLLKIGTDQRQRAEVGVRA